MRAVPSAELHAINDAAPQGATLDGIAVTLPDGLDEDTKQKILAAVNAIASNAKSDPFIDNPHIPQMSDGDSIITLADTASLLSLDVPKATTSNPQQAEPSSPVSFHFSFF